MYYPLRMVEYDRKVPYPSMRSQIDFEIDMLFDADKGELQYDIIETFDVAHIARKTKLNGIPIDNKKGWVPHITFDRNIGKTTIRIAKIPTDWFGQQTDCIFD